jgi:hypothetical protein
MAGKIIVYQNGKIISQKSEIIEGLAFYCMDRYNRNVN